MNGFLLHRMACVLSSILLCCTQLDAADQGPDAEDQFLKAIAEGDLGEVEKIATRIDLSEVTNLYFNALGSPNADVVDFLQEQEDLGISDLQILAIRGDAKAIKQFAESSDKAALKHELRRGSTGLWSYSPLMLALRNGRTAAARTLIEVGADVNERAFKHGTPLELAAEGGHLEIVKDLLKAGARINTTTDDYTALMRACIGGHPKVTKFLLKSGADVNLKRHDGQTAMHFAAKSGSAECIKLLLDRGADPNALASKKRTALYFAELYEHKAAIKVLRQAMEKSKKKVSSPKD